MDYLFFLSTTLQLCIGVQRFYLLPRAGVTAIKLILGVQTFRFGSIRGLSFFSKKLKPRIDI
jgi:hypothetical protein